MSDTSTIETVGIGVGTVIRKTVYPQIHVGTVLAIEADKAYLVGKRDETSTEWTLIACSLENLVHLEDTSGVDLPDFGAIGQALIGKMRAVDTYVAEAKQQMEDAQAQRAEATNLRTQYETRVRDNIISVASDYSWDNDEVNTLLDNLGLDRLTTTWRVAVDLTATQTVYIDVEASDLDDAIEQVEQYSDSDIDSEIDRYNWDVSDREVDRYSSEEVD